MAPSGFGTVSFGPEPTFNGVKVFAATMFSDRMRLGERATEWIVDHPHVEVREVIVTQSSDDAFHCLAMTFFYWDRSVA
ncbi:MAG TPA: hypothetical protein VFG83_05265 [Kofleriaceae bacterium]|nr:hypothetical protein [Kofleriaceae bacterium]